MSVPTPKAPGLVAEASVTAAIRLARELRAEGLILRRAHVTPAGEVSFDIGGYQDPDAPTVDEQPRFRSYAQLFDSQAAADRSGPKPDR